MSYLKPVSSGKAGLLTRLTYFIAKRRVGKVPTSLGVMAHNAHVLAAVGAFELTFERAHALDGRLKELVQMRAAMLVGCRFCVDIGAAQASKHGVTEDELRALVDFEQSSLFSALDKEVLRYADAMTTGSTPIDQVMSQRLTEKLGQAAMVEMTAAIAWENFRARFNHAFGMKEQGYAEKMVCLLSAAIPSTVTHAS